MPVGICKAIIALFGTVVNSMQKKSTNILVRTPFVDMSTALTRYILALLEFDMLSLLLKLDMI